MTNEDSTSIRGRGFLTKDDRKYLMGEKENPPEGSARRQKHRRIRERLENAIIDFQIIEQRLPDKDIEQVFEPAYDWGRERRKLNEEGKLEEYPQTGDFINGLVSFFNFFAYSMALGRIQQVNNLRNLVMTEGIESGLRKFMLNYHQDYLEYQASIQVEVTERDAMQNYLVNIDRSIPEKPNEAAEEILRLYNENRIPADFAQQLWDHYVGNYEDE